MAPIDIAAIFISAIISSMMDLTISASPYLLHSLNGSGLHRSLSASLFFPPEISAAMMDPGMECTTLFLEKIPSGAYVDPFQVMSLRDFDGPDVLIKDKVDIEKPEHLSEPHTVMVFTSLLVDGDTLRTNYTLPVHLRYHSISDSEDFATVNFRQPGVAVKCYNTLVQMPQYAYNGKTVKSERLPCDLMNQKLCDWTFISYNYDVPEEEMAAKVPVGSSTHFLPVVIGTALVTSAGCLFIVYQVTHQTVGNKGKKQSGKHKRL